MIELKFRLFNKKICKYVNSDDYIIDFNGSLYSTFFCQFKTVEESNFVIEQYTGLKDKNNIDIYVGDILTYLDFNGKQIYLLECDYTLLQNTEFLSIQNRVEIIGNIHETPELLENK